MADVTRILSAIEDGDPVAAMELLPLVYEELRTLAAATMAQENPGQTLDRQPPWSTKRTSGWSVSERSTNRKYRIGESDDEGPILSTLFCRSIRRLVDRLAVPGQRGGKAHE